MASRMNRPASNIGIQIETSCRSWVGIRAPGEEGGESGAEGSLARGRPAVLGEGDRILATLKLENVTISDFSDPGIEARVGRMNPIEDPIREFGPALPKQPVLHIDDGCKQEPEGDLKRR